MATEAALADLQAWLDTPTWEMSRRYLQGRPQLLTNPVTRTTLEANRHHPTMAQHLGIVRLAAAGMPLPDVYDLLTDPANAADTAMELAERGSRERLRDVFLAAPDLLAVPFTGPFLAGAFALLNQDVVLAVALRYRTQGVSWHELASGFGVRPQTLRRWRMRSGPSGCAPDLPESH